MDQLLTTKLHIPKLHSDFISRPRLYARLDEGSTRKLTLVSSPAGSGKSTLVAGWLEECKQPAAWLSLDQADNDPVRFWMYLIAALQTIHQELGEDARQLVSVPQLRSSEPAVVSLLNDISLFNGKLILVLDDYHVIEPGPVHAGMAFLLEHQPTNLHMVLITRADPLLSLARLRAHGQLIEVRAEDLQFSTEEATTLFNEKMGLHLNHRQIDSLTAHTESWAVGLQLAAISLRKHELYDQFIKEFTGGHQFVLDYLTEEVLDTLPDRLRDFLLRTSILERFCPKLCQAVTGDPSSPELLEQIRKSNLFLIPLDSEGGWFRYHQLFAEVLRALLVRDYPDEIPALHAKAAAWFENEWQSGEAVEHTLRAGDLTRTRELVLKYWTAALHRGEVVTVLRWLDALPEEMEREDPSIALAKCWVLFLSSRISAMGVHLEKANDAYERMAKEGALDGIQQNQFASQLAMMRSVLARAEGEHAKSVAYAEKAARLMPPVVQEGVATAWNMLAGARSGAGDFLGAIEAYKQGITQSLAVGNLVGAYGCTYGQVMYTLLQGGLNEAASFCRSAIEKAVREGHGDIPAAGSLYVTMARIELERYHLDEAQVALDTGLRISRPGGFGEAERTGRYLRAHLAAARGDLEAARGIFEETGRIVGAMDDPYLTGELNAEWAKLCLRGGDLDGARKKLHILEEKLTATQHANLTLWWRSLYPRLLCEQGQTNEALTALEEFINHAREVHSQGELIRLLVLQAVALHTAGRGKAASSAVQEALAMAAPEGYIWRWLDAGPGIEPLLAELNGDQNTAKAFQPYLDAVLDACRTAFGEVSSPQPGQPPGLLTQRELEILRLICKGYSNPEIACELVVTLNTVKKHTSNIFNKLSVRSRTQAIARAYELNLV